MNPYIGEIAALSAAMLWAGSMCIFRARGASFHPQVLNLFKSLIAMGCMGISILVIHPHWPTWQSAGMLGLSGIIGIAVGDTALFSCLQRIGAQLTSATQCLGPPVAAVIAWYFLGEPLNSMEIIGMLVTVCAVLGSVIFARPYLKFTKTEIPAPKTHLWSGVLFGFLSATANATGLVIIRNEIQKTDVLSATFVRTLSSTLVLGTFCYLSAHRTQFRPLFKNPYRLGVAAFSGTFLGLLLMSTAAKYTKAGVATSLLSTYPVWIIPIAALTLGERIGWRSMVCIGIAVLGVVLMFQ